MWSQTLDSVSDPRLISRPQATSPARHTSVWLLAQQELRSREGVKHGTVMTLKVKSGSPGGLPRGTGALTPVLAAPTTGAKVGLRQGRFLSQSACSGPPPSAPSRRWAPEELAWPGLCSPRPGHS